MEPYNSEDTAAKLAAMARRAYAMTDILPCWRKKYPDLFVDTKPSKIAQGGHPRRAVKKGAAPLVRSTPLPKE